MEPAAREGLVRGRGVLQVALHDDVAAEHDLPHGLAVGRGLHHRLGVHDGHALLQRVAHALPAVQAGLLGEVLRRPGLALHRHRGRAVDLGQPVGVRDPEAHARHALDHRGRRRGAGHHAVHRLRDARALVLGSIDDEVVDDGRGAVVRHAVIAHGREDGRGVHAPQANVRAAHHGQRPGEAPAVAVEHRQRPQVAREVRQRPGDGVAHGVEVGAAVVGDHALGVAGGAAGVAHGDGVPLVGRALQPGQRLVRGQPGLVLVRAQALAGAGVLAVAHVDDDDLAAVLLAQPAQRLVHDRAELEVGDQHPGLAVVHLPGQQRRVQPRVQRVQHRPQGRHGVVRLDHLRRVGQHHADGVAAAHAQRRQRRSQARRALAALRPGVAPLAVDHRGQVGEDLGASLDEAHRRQRHVVGRVPVEVLVVDAGHGGLLCHEGSGATSPGG